MGLLSFLKRNRDTDKPSASSKASADDVQRVRTRARQRLIGAVVLLGIGVIGFPLVFETQPRPIPVDIPIEIPRKDAAAPLVAPPPRPRQEPASQEPAKPQVKAAPQMITETAADAGKEVQTPAKEVQTPAKEVPTAVASSPEKAPPPQPARAKAEEKPAAKPDAAAKDGRYIVQVGAFSEASSARETRVKAEKLGFKTYTQVVDTDSGKRIRVRVGPFASRDEADRAAGKLKSAGLSSAVLGL